MKLASWTAGRFALFAIAIISLLLGGCAHKLHFNCGDGAPPASNVITSNVEQAETKVVAAKSADLDAAMGCVRQLRREMQGKVKELDTTAGVARVGVLAGGLAAAGGALYRAHRDFIVGATAVGFGSYTIGNLYSPTPILTVYQNGIQATGCVSSVARIAAASIAQIKDRRAVLQAAMMQLHNLCPNGVCAAPPAPAITPPSAAVVVKKPEAARLRPGAAKGGRDPLAPKRGVRPEEAPVDKPVSSAAPTAGGSDSSAGASPAVERNPAATLAKGRQLMLTSENLLSQQPLAAKIVEAVHSIADTVDRQVADHTPSLDAFLSASQNILSAARASAPQLDKKTPEQKQEAARISKSFSEAEIRAIDAVENAAAALDSSIKSFGDATALGNTVGECAKVTTVTPQPLTISPANTEVALDPNHTITADGGLRPYHGEFIGAKPDTGEILWSRTPIGEFKFEKKGEIKRDYTFVIRDAGGGDKLKQVTLVFKASKKEDTGAAAGGNAGGAGGGSNKPEVKQLAKPKK